jgi:glycine/D-amino acid oxidase-like deaminating enzyme
MAEKEKIVIIGGGLVGSATAYQAALLAKAEGRNVDIILLEAGKKGELRGGSDGESRITREITFENPIYAELARESNLIADKLGIGIVRPANVLILGNDTDYILKKAYAAAEKSNAKYDVVNGSLLEDQFPYLNPKGLQGVNEHAFNPKTGKGAGVLNPALLVTRLQEAAAKLGVTIQHEASVKKVTDAADGGATITLKSGETINVDKAVVSVGAWAEHILDHPVARAVTPKMGPLFYYKVPEEMEEKFKNFPALIYKLSGGAGFVAQHPDFVARNPDFPLHDKNHSEGFYMMMERDLDGTMWIKVGHSEPAMQVRHDVDVLSANHKIASALGRFTADFMREFLPGLAEVIPSIKTGWAEKTGKGPMAFTPEDRPIIDTIGDNKAIVVAEFCNGGGAKTACAVGEMVAHYALGTPERIPENRRKEFSLEGRNLPALPDGREFSDVITAPNGLRGVKLIRKNMKSI